jgi:LPS export ABC transporter protein LptC
MDYSGSNIIQDISEEIPNTIIYKYKTVEVQNGKQVLEIKADLAEVYNSKEETYLKNVEFYNYKDNEVNNQGKSNSAILNMKSGNAQLNGSIVIESIKDETSLKAESLNWIDEKKILSSNYDDSVLVKESDGSILQGQGFSADIKRKTILFEGKTEGKYITDEN